MNNEDLRLLASLTFKARPLVKIDSTRLIKDKEYSDEIFRQIEAEGDEDLVILALTLRNNLGLIGSNAKEVVEQKSNSDKYKFGARS